MWSASLTLRFKPWRSQSITSTLSKSRACCSKIACSAAADISNRPFLTKDACSLTRTQAVRPVSPMYACSQSPHLRRYTTPGSCSRLVRSFGDHFQFLGFPTTLTFRGLEILCRGWVTPSINGTVWGNPDQNVVAQTICCCWTCGFAWWLWFPSKNHHWNQQLCFWPDVSTFILRSSSKDMRGYLRSDSYCNPEHFCRLLIFVLFVSSTKSCKHTSSTKERRGSLHEQL